MDSIVVLILILLGTVLLAMAGRKLFGWLMERKVLASQNDLIEKHREEVESIYEQMRGWRHDYKHHIQTMKAHLAMAQYEELDHYLSELDEDLTSVDMVLKTGNVRIDAVLNSKLALARAKGIQVNAKAIVSGKLGIGEVDLCVILGNLLDNAIEACAGGPMEKQFIRVYIDILKQQLYISVTNSMSAHPQKRGGKYLSTKQGGYHGMGLVQIDKAVKKYGGYINRQHEEGVFATEIMLPL